MFALRHPRIPNDQRVFDLRNFYFVENLPLRIQKVSDFCQQRGTKIQMTF